jgi:hypothetical protein
MVVQDAFIKAYLGKSFTLPKVTDKEKNTNAVGGFFYLLVKQESIQAGFISMENYFIDSIIDSILYITHLL